VAKIGTLSNPEFDIDLSSLKVCDFGDVSSSLELEEAHKALTLKVEELLSSNVVPFVVGGGNDQSYANARALMQHVKNTGSTSVGVVNVDAHLDVRPLKEGKVHSGSPFRLLLEDSLFAELNGKFVEFASQGHQCSAEHWSYLTQQPAATIIPLSTLRGSVLGGLSHQQRNQRGVEDTFFDLLDGTIGENIFLSFDIDSIQSSDCPGVSAPGNIGLTAQEALNICFLAGKSPRVKLVDVSEYNPTVEEFRTGRLVVLMFYYFLLGYAQRTTTN
jgi:formiminoglutamase